VSGPAATDNDPVQLKRDFKSFVQHLDPEGRDGVVLDGAYSAFDSTKIATDPKLHRFYKSLPQANFFVPVRNDGHLDDETKVANKLIRLAREDVEKAIGFLKNLFLSLSPFHHAPEYFNAHFCLCVALCNLQRYPDTPVFDFPNDIPAAFLSDDTGLEDIEEPISASGNALLERLAALRERVDGATPCASHSLLLLSATSSAERGDEGDDENSVQYVDRRDEEVQPSPIEAPESPPVDISTLLGPSAWPQQSTSASHDMKIEQAR